MRRGIGRMMAAAVALMALGECGAYAQEGAAEKSGETVGRKIDQALKGAKRGAEKIGQDLREGFDRARDKVDAMSVEARVYGRLHWDKALNGAAITLEAREPNILVLKGSVASEADRAKALTLAKDTVGVGSVVDELSISEPSVKTTTTKTTTTTKPR